MEKVAPEDTLSFRDPAIAGVIAAQTSRWPNQPTEDPIWGLIRIVMAQQVSTHLACTIAERATSAFPQITVPERNLLPSLADFRALGLPERRAQCCVELLNRSQELLAKVDQGQTWENALAGIKGIGPWTIATFRIMVLRHLDVLPLGDVGLERAVRNVYGEKADVEQLGELWRPYRSVACWYLWRTLGNKQLG
jgi:DNA-3-methyladenine glycosylase II